MASALASSASVQRCFSSRPLAVQHRRAAALRTVVVRAEAGPAIKPPQGVTLPLVKPSPPASTFGFVFNAERLNSRAAMIGFFALLLLELVAGQGILDLAGFKTGNGLGFEF